MRENDARPATLVLDKNFWAITLFSLAIAVVLTVALWDINYLPSDAEVYFIPAAAKLHTLTYLSQMHESFDQFRIRWLHGKEILVLLLSWAQQLLHDPVTLRPLIVLCVAANFLSSVLIFLISRFLWGLPAALACFFFFTTSFWPYVYILLTRHQPFGLCLFLVSLFLVCCSPRHLLLRSALYFCAGALFCAGIFSSTTASLYIPCLAAAFFWTQFKRFGPGGAWFKYALGHGLLMLLGFGAVFIYVNYPNVAHNVKGYLEYIDINRHYNHFYYNQIVLKQWLADPDIGHVRGGWPWIIKYFFLIMPVLFPLYCASLVYLIRRACTVNNMMFRASVAGMILLSCSPPMIAEFKSIAQYGSNYFSSMIGILCLTGFAFFLFIRDEWPHLQRNTRRALAGAGVALAIVHLSCNLFIFCADVYPTRMVTTFISEMIERNKTYALATYYNNPLRRSILDQLNPGTLNKMTVTPIVSLAQVSDGYILVPPISQDTIYTTTSSYTDFDSDLVLNRLVKENRLKDYAVASFKTMGSSLIWGEEEEIMAYRYLLLNQFPRNMEKSKAWLLDAQKLQRDRDTILPSPEDVFLSSNNIRDIGTSTLAHTYTGQEIRLNQQTIVTGILARTYKVGLPTDGLAAYVYKADPPDKDVWIAWIPFSGDSASIPVAAQDISANQDGGATQFKFARPLTLDKGRYTIIIYRTGPTDDRNFYRLYQAHVHLQ